MLFHGAVGGITSVLGGGKFGHGFASGGVTALGTSLNNSRHIGRLGFSPLRVAIGAVVGGTASRITGGKFANGANTGAFSQALNQEQAEVRMANQPTDQNETLLEGVTRTEVENGILYERDGASVLVQNDVAGGPIPAVDAKQISDTLSVSSATGEQVQIISGYRGPDHPLYRRGAPHEVDGAIDVRIRGFNSEEVANALFESGRFNRVSSYTDGRSSAHADYRQWGSQGRFQDWRVRGNE